MYRMTPDSWVPRCSKLLRLTASHPLNAEPKLTEMYAAGMITPTKYLSQEPVVFVPFIETYMEL